MRSLSLTEASESPVDYTRENTPRIPGQSLSPADVKAMIEEHTRPLHDIIFENRTDLYRMKTELRESQSSRKRMEEKISYLENWKKTQMVTMLEMKRQTDDIVVDLAQIQVQLNAKIKENDEQIGGLKIKVKDYEQEIASCRKEIERQKLLLKRVT
ncbi:Oidioi.mRNA.OKI2018_I69.chr1.g3771.t1.cds [Oikopleura dioica]|uniref:Oidioi.mRNA.OKI2018_I69.chr1.g3771.t1.cds n=1 Tax=Oikopleura dioica TaxID=34765 RepID=A0ABN7SYQ9_OIKDI|nr:Oidioi.mRNA.OKI2018_I69.chr1.g3771.t1.cds [Oikopleura dioica]